MMIYFHSGNPRVPNNPTYISHDWWSWYLGWVDSTSRFNGQVVMADLQLQLSWQLQGPPNALPLKDYEARESVLPEFLLKETPCLQRIYEVQETSSPNFLERAEQFFRGLVNFGLPFDSAVKSLESKKGLTTSHL